MEDYRINRFGFGMLKSTNKKISKQMEIAASIISLAYLQKKDSIDKPLYDYQSSMANRR
jgi:hypothetical protein